MFVGVEPVAPACQLVEVALLVALVEVVLWNRVQYRLIVGCVVSTVHQTYAQRVVIQMLHAVVHVAIVNKGLFEGFVHRGRNVLQLGIVGLLGQQLGIVGYVEERIYPLWSRRFAIVDSKVAVHAL